MNGVVAQLLLFHALAAGSGEPVVLSGADGGPPDPAQQSQLSILIDDTIKKLAETANQEGLRFFKFADYPAALESFRQAFEYDPENPEIANNLGFIYFMLGNHERAEYFYRLTLRLAPERFIAYLNLADLLHNSAGDPTRLKEASELLTRARELRGNDVEVIIRQARVAALRGLMDEAERFYREAVGQARPSNELKIEIGDFYRNMDLEDDALTWYGRVSGERDAVLRAQDRIRQMEVERQARRFGWARMSTEVPARAKSLENKARLLMKQGRMGEAEAALQESVRMAPQFSAARIALADVYTATARESEAETEYLRALAYDQSNPEIHARLGALYLTLDEGMRSAEAALLLTRALQLRPDWTDLHLSLAKALRASGDLAGALKEVNLYLDTVKSEESRREAQQLRTALEQLVTREPPDAARRWAARSDPPRRALVEHLNRAQAYLARGEADEAMAELNQVMAQERGVEVRNLEGRILRAAGRHEEAAAAFRASLELDEKQPDVHQQLALVLLGTGHRGEARRHLLRAEQLGDLNSTYELARMDLEDGREDEWSWISDVTRLERMWVARARLMQFLAQTNSPVHLDDARDLKDEVDRRLSVLAFVVLLLLGAIMSLVVSLARRRWGGDDLHALITRHPEAGPEVQRLLSSIRHEVLKHNTMVLTGLVEAIERGEDVADKVEHLRRSLFGVAGERAVVHRLQGYEEQLAQIGRAYGMRLNLKQKDPALRALNEGFDLLRRAVDSLEKASKAPPRKRRGKLGDVKRAARLLNVEAYEAVRGLLDRLRVLEVDEGLLRGIYQRTCGEPALANVPVRPLVLDVEGELPCGVCIPRAALEDILGNLMRNAIQSSLRSGMKDIEVGLGVRSEVNAITGHERVLFLVRDRSPQALNLDVLLGQKIEGGLGITAELVSRYDGSLSVEDRQDGWKKAVVVKLPREELPDDAEVANAA